MHFLFNLDASFCFEILKTREYLGWLKPSLFVLLIILFPARISPSEMKKKKMKAAIDAGVKKEEIMENYLDPHLYTEAIKSYLR